MSVTFHGLRSWKRDVDTPQSGCHRVTGRGERLDVNSGGSRFERKEILCQEEGVEGARGKVVSFLILGRRRRGEERGSSLST